MEPNGLRTLLTGRGLLESPRWHGDRLTGQAAAATGAG